MGDYIDLEYFQNYTQTAYDGTTTPTATFVETLIETFILGFRMILNPESEKIMKSKWKVREKWKYKPQPKN